MVVVVQVVEGLSSGGQGWHFFFNKQYDDFTESRMQAFYESLSEKDRRRYSAMEAMKLGHGGIHYIASVLGCSRRTIEHGIADLQSLPNDDAENRVRRPGAGRKKATEADPKLVENFFCS